MTNVTLSIDDQLLKRARRYASQHHTSLNDLIRSLLTSTVGNPSEDWLEACFQLADRAGANSRGKTWKREDLYDV